MRISICHVPSVISRMREGERQEVSIKNEEKNPKSCRDHVPPPVLHATSVSSQLLNTFRPAPFSAG
ncbi:hypothetical protein T07_5365 [Trichinella nelsoni]|uniref:Uncharacterized protein n=1 Tax=Trichinella nelsoni TaxID=6336 RepID=A0A0V0SE82_9BILA|nr:hypothetical protein T07_5365 [Trichinella nelsoni]